MSSSDNKEIEKKFEVISNDWFYGTMRTQEIFQAYFTDPNDGENKRIRIIPSMSLAIITQKKDLGVIDGVLEREEIEYSIDFQKGLKLFLDCPVFIHKVRHFYPYHDFVFEIDKYVNLKESLVTAEVEMKADEIPKFNALPLPNWIGRDWSLDKDYSNYNLLKKVNSEFLVPAFVRRLLNVETLSIKDNGFGFKGMK